MTVRGSRFADLIDLEGYVLRRVRVLNANGGRGYDHGVRVFDCPLCRETRGRGWANVLTFAVGCLNAGCPAEERLPGGVVEWVRRAEGLRTWPDTLTFLLREYPRRSARRPAPVVDAHEDFVRYPKDVRWLWSASSPIMHEAMVFARRQWGVSGSDLQRWGVGVCASGRYAWRLVIPVVMDGNPVAFQARTFRGGEPKYLFAREGPASDPQTECGREAAGCLFNYDAVHEGGEFVLVEGAGDVMAHAARTTAPTAVGLLGQALTAEKLALIAVLRPRRVVVALDQGVAERRRALDHVADLRAWGVAAELGEWVGGKDAGEGARLAVIEGAVSLSQLVAEKVGASR